jgi:hypothetical protein
MQDEEIIKSIKDITATEQQLSSRGNLSEREVRTIYELKIKRNQYFDLLKERGILRERGKNPDEAKMRPPDLVENYKTHEFEAHIEGFSVSKPVENKN